MRVIAGIARSMPLKSVEGLGTRPTTDRAKETLFNILQPYLEGTSFLDLFSGSGAIAIEALSRGARQAVLVENNKQAIACIEENLTFTKLNEKAQIIKSDVLHALYSLSTKGDFFDIIFMDPPYNMEYEKEVLFYLSQSDLVNFSTIIVVETSLKNNFSYVEDMNFSIYREKKYKTNKHVFLKRI